MSREEKEKAIAFYSLQIKENPKAVYAYVYRSACHESLGNFDASLSDALRIIKLKPSYWKGHHQALKLYIHFGDVSKAEKIIRKYADDESFDDLIENFKQMHHKEKTILVKAFEGIKTIIRFSIKGRRYVK